MNFDYLRAEMESREIAPAEYEEAYSELSRRTESMIRALPGGEWGEPRRIREFSLVLRQVLLHRAIKLFEGAINALIHDNAYSMALSVRGHFETTAAIGYLHNRLASLQEGNLAQVTVDKDIVTQILGTRDEELLKEAGEDALEAKQVLSMLEYADKSVSRHIMDGATKEHVMLMDIYKWLCEFSHPNYHSNSVAFSLDKEKGEFSFTHNSQILEREAKVIENILLSSPIFTELYDRIENLLPEA